MVALSPITLIEPGVITVLAAVLEAQFPVLPASNSKIKKIIKISSVIYKMLNIFNIYISCRTRGSLLRFTPRKYRAHLSIFQIYPHFLV
jgi:hypothetical protein